MAEYIYQCRECYNELEKSYEETGITCERCGSLMERGLMVSNEIVKSYLNTDKEIR